MPKPKLALMVQLEREYDQWHAVARPAVLTGDDDVYRYPQTVEWSDRELWKFADFSVRSYVGNGFVREMPMPEGRADIFWSYGVEYRPTRVERVDHAKAMVSTLVKVRTGLERTNDTVGQLRPGDFAGYVYRVGSILGIPDVYWRNEPDRRAMSGEAWSRVSLNSLGYRLDQAVDSIRKDRSVNLYR